MEREGKRDTKNHTVTEKEMQKESDLERKYRERERSIKR